MLFGRTRGVLVRFAARRRLQRKGGRQNRLRAVYELLQKRAEARGEVEPLNETVKLGDLLNKRSWTPWRLKRLIGRAMRSELVDYFDGTRLCLSESGFGEAARTTRNHLLWEEYLVTHADVASQHIDRDADMVEHILGPAMVRELEQQLVRRGYQFASLSSRHPITGGGLAL
jgi:hypothetical protein